MYFKRWLLRSLVLVSLITVLLVACNKSESISDDNYFGGKVMILGHRGMGISYYKPGNTLDAILPVIGIGADGSEMDIQMTRDSELVIYHNDELDQITTCSGRIYEQHWAQIKQCKYYALQNMIFINSVDDLFRNIPHLTNYYFSFDCKIDQSVVDIESYKATYLRAIKRICDKFEMSNNVFIEGDDDLLNKAQQLGLTNKLCMNTGLTQETINTAYNHHFFGISTSIDLLDLVDNAHQKGLYIMAWSPGNYSENKMTLAKKADIIQSDDPISILKLLERFNYEYVIP